MKIDFSVATILFFAAIVQGIFSASLLLFTNKNRNANMLLGLLMLGITGWLIDAFFRVANIYGQNPHLYFLPIYYSFAFGPLLYLYVKTITNSSFIFKRGHLFHFLPVFIQAIFYLVISFQSYETKYHIWTNLHSPYTYRIEYDGSWLSLVIYLCLSIRLVFHYQKWLNDNFTQNIQKTLNWLKICLLVMMFICICWLFEAILRDAKGVYYKYDYSGDLLCIIIFILGIYGYQQANLNLSFEPERELLLPKPAVAVVDTALVNRIDYAMQVDRLYLNPELSLADVASHLNISAKTVSANINAAFNKPFNTYVNTFRVEAIKKRFEGNDAKKLTLLGIAFESGFNSKTSFNRIFKEFTGLSPTQYIKK